MSTLQHQDVFEPYYAEPKESDNSSVKNSWKKPKTEPKEDDERPVEKH